MAAAASTLASSAMSELYTFDYNKVSASDAYYVTTVHATSPTAQEWTTISGQESVPNKAEGYLSFAAGANAQGANSSVVTNGVSLVDFGGNVGQVLCLNGASSAVATDLKKLSNGVITSVPSMSWTGWVNLNWIVGTSAYNGNVRVAITYSVYSPNADINSPSDFACKGNGGSSTLVSTATTYSSSNFKNGDAWDGTVWKKYVADGKMGNGSVRFQFNLPGLGNQAIFIKKVEFFKLDSSDETLTNATVEDADFTPNQLFKYDNTTIAIGKASLKQVAATGLEVAGSSEAYPAYYSKINAFDIPFTVNLDKNKIGDGKTATLKAELIANSGLSSQGSLGTYTFTVPATSETVECAFKNVLYRLNYQIKLTSVQYSDESEATVKEVSSEIYTNELPKPSVTISLEEKYSALYKLSSTTTCAIFEDTLETSNTEFVGYVSFSVSQADNDNIDAGILTQGYALGDSEYGLTGYIHRDSSDEYNEEIHNWAIIAEQQHFAPLHIANITSGVLTRTISVSYPMLANHTQVVVGDAAETEFTVAKGDVNTNNLGVTTKTADYTFDDSELAQTSVANIAVEANAAVEYFNLQGVRVAADALTPGIYVRRAGNTASKVIVK
jgi:hypothetical protein